jgi:hypothetical protein
MRAAIAIGMLVLGASAGTLTTLPRPTFPGPAAAPSGPHRLVLLSSTRVGVSNLGISSISVSGPSFHGLPPQSIFSTANRKFVLYGRDGSTGRYLVAYAGLVYEQPMWAQERNGVLYVENAHLTYAAASYNRNAYITAIDLKMRRAIWRSPALVANAFNFLVTSRYVIAGYGFTNEPDYLYVLDRQTGRVLDRLLLPNGPERITLRGNVVHVRTYDHVVLAHLRGA